MPLCCRSHSITSGSTDTTVDDERHQFNARGPSSVPWSPALTSDFVVLEYDRQDGAVVGYQRSTGKVFAQRRPGSVDHHQNLQLDHAVLLGISNKDTVSTLGFDTEHACEALTLAPHIEVTDTAWKILEHPDETSHGQSWSVHSATQSGERSVEISSNRDAILSCMCTWADTKTMWRAVRGVARSLGCVPNSAALGKVPVAIQEITNRKQVRFCRELSATLAFRAIVAVNAHDMMSEQSDKSCWLHALATRTSITAADAAGIDSVRLPRAAVTTDIKYAMKSIEVAQSIAAAVSKNSHLILTGLLGRLLVKWKAEMVSVLYPPYSAESVENELNELGESDLVPFQIPLHCDGPFSHELFSLLSSRNAAFTPESANTTRLGMQFARHVLELTECISSQIRSLVGFTDCVQAVHHTSAEFGKLTPSPDIVSLFGHSAIPFDAATAQLRNILTENYRSRALRSRQQMQDVSDKAVGLAISVVEAQLRETRDLASSFASGVKSYQTRYNTITTIPHVDNTTEMFHFLGDTWCCGSMRPTPLANISRPCVNHIERLIRRFR